MGDITRRDWLKGATAAWAIAQGNWGGVPALAAELPHARPPRSERHFTSAAVEALIPRVQRGIGDPALATIFENCFPNTLDTTVFPGSFEGKPDTYIVTGDIDAMWLRDSSAQVWPYLPLAKQDPQLRQLLEFVGCTFLCVFHLDWYILKLSVKYERSKSVPKGGARLGE